MRILKILLFIAILYSCSKKEDSAAPNYGVEIDYFKHQILNPVVRINSYDSIKQFNCGLTPFPLSNQKAFTYDIDEDFQADFRIQIKHKRFVGSGCPYFHYEVSIEGIGSNILIATDTNFVLEFDEGELVQSNNWTKSALIVSTNIDPIPNHTFYGKKYIAFSISKESKLYYGYFKIEFSQTDLFIIEYAVNFENSNQILAGQKE